MVRCKDCKWWAQVNEHSDRPAYRYCLHEKNDDFADPPDGFGTADGEPFNGSSFASGPDFGCVHGEQKYES